MEKKYQVFVSSTYQDLIAERQEVMQALLELDCMPSGMELFPAADEDQWSLIKRVIEECDYYVVIIGGRYGSIGPEDISYTRMEYEYALSKNKPVIAFLHKSPDELPASKTERTEKGRKQLEEFRVLAQKKMCKFWLSPSGLGSVVSRSLIKLIKAKPAVGWVRADLVPDQAASQEILRLNRKIEELQAIIENARTVPPEGTEDLSQGQDNFSFEYNYTIRDRNSNEERSFSTSLMTTWNELFSAISPLLINEAPEYEIKGILKQLIVSKEYERLKKKYAGSKKTISFNISDDDFHTIKIQLRALGLITMSTRQKSVKDTTTYWTLTPYGDTVMTRLRAQRRTNIEQRKKRR